MVAMVGVNNDRVINLHVRAQKLFSISDLATDAIWQREILLGEWEGRRIDVNGRHVLIHAREHRCQRSTCAADQKDFVRPGLLNESKDRVNI